ncbi:MAG: NAD+ synthase [Burkholderiales bacterium]|nr:NAD+ synthase [Burkholderiales bacterium]
MRQGTKIAIAQINCLVGDLEGNSTKILDMAKRARDAGASLLLTPELSLCGYPPEDLLLRPGFVRACDEVLNKLALDATGIALVVGHPVEREGRRCNAASLIRDGMIEATYFKHELPNYAVFDEERYFDSGSDPVVFELDAMRFGLAICEDVWKPAPARLAKDAGAEVLLVLNASPYHMEKQQTRYAIARERVKDTGLALVYANMTGGQDELVFDGASFVMNRDAEIVRRLASFEESLGFVEFENHMPVEGEIVPEPGLEASVYRALCLGVSDYVAKNRFPGVLLGLSGGIDSALTLAIAVDALGAEKVHAVMMPSMYTSDISIEDSRQMARTLGVRYSELAIQPIYELFLETLEGEFAGMPGNTAEENIQARVRGTLLMALSNKHGSIVLTTGNKSEMAVGYSTLYGDMAGGFAVLKDIRKTLVYCLAHYRNGIGRVIPERVITRPPSAELKAGQCDQDSLPPYEVLDAVMEAYMEQDLSLQDIVKLGIDEKDARQVVHLIRVNEYKRRQSPVGIRITQRGFGRDWRYPITSKFLDEY